MRMKFWCVGWLSRLRWNCLKFGNHYKQNMGCGMFKSTLQHIIQTWNLFLSFSLLFICCFFQNHETQHNTAHCGAMRVRVRRCVHEYDDACTSTTMRARVRRCVHEYDNACIRCVTLYNIVRGTIKRRLEKFLFSFNCCHVFGALL